MEMPDTVDFDPETGLVPAVVQADDGRVLVLAYMNRRALERTLGRGRVTFWSRSREELWEKGATSGNWLEALEVRADCDGDALLVRARPHGPACHTGEASCFDAGPSRRVRADAAGRRDGAADGPGRDDAGSPVATGVGEDGAAGADLSGAASSPAPVLASVLEELVRVVARRDRERPEGSHTASLLEGGTARAARKVGEEAVETVLAAVDGPEQLVAESADLLYHLVVLWRAAGLPADSVGRELAGRRPADDRRGVPEGDAAADRPGADESGAGPAEGGG